jgi:hypothetical protein
MSRYGILVLTCCRNLAVSDVQAFVIRQDIRPAMKFIPVILDCPLYLGYNASMSWQVKYRY